MSTGLKKNKQRLVWRTSPLGCLCSPLCSTQAWAMCPHSTQMSGPQSIQGQAGGPTAFHNHLHTALGENTKGTRNKITQWDKGSRFQRKKFSIILNSPWIREVGFFFLKRVFLESSQEDTPGCLRQSLLLSNSPEHLSEGPRGWSSSQARWKGSMGWWYSSSLQIGLTLGMERPPWNLDIQGHQWGKDLQSPVKRNLHLQPEIPHLWLITCKHKLLVCLAGWPASFIW